MSGTIAQAGLTGLALLGGPSGLGKTASDLLSMWRKPNASGGSGLANIQIPNYSSSFGSRYSAQPLKVFA
jgi:hypothetical protein